MLTNTVNPITGHVLKAQVRVRNPMGLHARPATHIVKLLHGKKVQVQFSYRKNRVDAKSVLGLLLLGAPCNAKISIEISGPEAERTLELLKIAFEQGLGDNAL